MSTTPYQPDQSQHSPPVPQAAAVAPSALSSTVGDSRVYADPALIKEYEALERALAGGGGQKKPPPPT